MKLLQKNGGRKTTAPLPLFMQMKMKNYFMVAAAVEAAAVGLAGWVADQIDSECPEFEHFAGFASYQLQLAELQAFAWLPCNT